LMGIAERLAAAPAKIERPLSAALADTLPLNARDGNFIRDRASNDLDEHRRLRDGSRQVIAGLQATYAEATGIKSLKVRHNNVLGYFVEVTALHGPVLTKPPHAELFIHRQTLAGQVRFSTTELGELEARIVSAGDRALVRVARILSSHRRAGETVARTGGEEFTLLLPNTSEHDAYLAAERMRIAVAGEFASDPVPLTFSFGVANFPDHGSSGDAVIESADQALYAAKALGRNRSIIFNREISAIFAPEGGGRGLDASRLPTLLSLTEALDIRDAGTAHHSRTVARYCVLIAEQLGLEPAHVERVEMAGRLHDIGKVGVPNEVLQKPGPLGAREMAQIRTHPEIGAEVLSGEGLEDLCSWVIAHHERPDGRGYPKGLTDGEIPLEAKIIAVADAYEAMTADRVYRTGIGSKAARVELLRCAGTQFDSRVTAAFMAVLDSIEREPDTELAGLRS